VKQELLTLPEHLSSPPVREVRVTRSFVLGLCFVYCLSICTFFFWPLCCLFFEIRIMITLLLSSNSSYVKDRLGISKNQFVLNRFSLKFSERVILFNANSQLFHGENNLYWMR
jgi:hypothetical protein